VTRPTRGLAAVVERVPAGACGYHRLTLHFPMIAAVAEPGQFVHVLAPPPRKPAGVPGQPFLRRPISLHDVDPAAGTIDLLFKVKGAGTRGLSEVSPGDALDLIGPLGRGFPPSLAPRSIVVGGGAGVAPLLLLVRRLASGSSGLGGRSRSGLSVLLGLAGEADLDLVAPFRPFVDSGALVVATEDGAPGTVQGLVTDLLEATLREKAERDPGGATPPGGPVIYACGPHPMLASVHRLAVTWAAEAWVSLEDRLACGVGACRGCAVAVRRLSPEEGVAGGPIYRRVCVDGPVFSSGEVDWSAL
jgi:dihydroorotate dehydrogenase electron transfer subunit